MIAVVFLHQHGESPDFFGRLRAFLQQRHPGEFPIGRQKSCDGAGGADRESLGVFL